MNSTTESTARRLTWKQTGKLESQLVEGEEVVATLNWAKGWGSLATGESIRGAWTFKRAGVLAPKITVQVPGSSIISATLSMGWKGGGSIALASGRSLRLAPKGFWRSEWVLTDDSEKRLMSIKPSLTWGSVGATVCVEDAALLVEELPLLAVLCWYAVLLVSYDNSSGDGAIVASLVATGSI